MVAADVQKVLFITPVLFPSLIKVWKFKGGGVTTVISGNIELGDTVGIRRDPGRSVILMIIIMATCARIIFWGLAMFAFELK